MENKVFYDKGATDAYYGRSGDMSSWKEQDLTKEQKAAYWNGYNDEPYGRKDYGYAEE